MNVKKMKLPILIGVIALILAVAACLLSCVRKEPLVKEQDFEYSVTYRLDGEEHTLTGVYRCSFTGYDSYDDPTMREYAGRHVYNGTETGSFYLALAEKNGVTLYVTTELDADYLMGDPEDDSARNEDPTLEAENADGYEVAVSEFFDAEIVDWTYPEPIENSFRFTGFSLLHTGSMLVMLLVGALAIVACVVFVKKEEGFEPKVFDGFSVAANFVVGFAAIPMIVIIVALLPLTTDATSLIHQMYLCVPVLTAFTIAASVALRRKGFAKSALFVQFVFPVLFFTELVVEAIISTILL